MGEVKVTLVTDSFSGFQAVYYDEKLLVDLGDNCNSRQDAGYNTIGDLLEALTEKLEIWFEDRDGAQLLTKPDAYFESEPEGYWPDQLSQVPKGFDADAYARGYDWTKDEVSPDGNNFEPVGSADTGD